MISYGIGILLLVFELCTAHPHIMQLWYADNSGAGGTFKVLHDHIQDLFVRGPLQGYFTEPTKIILVVFPWDFQKTETHF